MTEVSEIFDSSLLGLARAMELAAKRQEVITHNLANANTPAYEALRFDEVLEKTVKRDKKEVVIEEEMAALAENSVKYSAYVKLLSSKINILRTIATQGRR